MENNFILGLAKEKELLEQEIKEYSVYIDKINKARDRVSAISNVILLYSSSKEVSIINVNKTTQLVDNQYDINWTWEDKVLYIVKKLQQCYASDVAKSIKIYEPNIKDERASTVASLKLSSLLKEDKIIKISQSGNKYKYGHKN